MTALHGPGKYDDLCTIVRKRSRAQAALVIIVGGNKGAGFSFQGDLLSLHGVPDMLEHVAKEIRAAQGSRQ